MEPAGPPRLRGYRVLLRLYPRWFRREYGEDLLQAFRDELRDRGAVRGWLRVIADLFVSIPAQHREAVMAHRSSSSDLVGVVLTGTAVLALVAFGGIFALAALLVIAVLTFARWRRMVPYREALRQSNSRGGVCSSRGSPSWEPWSWPRGTGPTSTGSRGISSCSSC